ncbi:TetR/AcrR family transcriptional regulator [Thermobifida halotolerans]|uniref:TetR/AcrR family transcriptional regulator n=1 Tax=Thermobifida halotolerans TaxID=483545 RepID=A0A399G8N4_9ACTN|nr:TetR/AcrR family transcriptional regulator [Thermobifida halotolerans]UOE21044.1 TetR/AcrR family transcriptional regulator [Thermobifida halotolerans]
MSSPPSRSPSSRPLRKDAEENRRRILRAAREVFAERGLEAALDDIALRAGVGVGTVYRRFSGKEALVEALFEEQIDAMVALAEEALAVDDPWEGFVRFTVRANELFVRDRGLREATLLGTYGRDRVARARDRLVPAIRAVVERVQRSGRLRSDITDRDMPIIGMMLGSVSEYVRTVRPEVWKRYLLIILDGLRTPDPSPLPDPLTPEELDALLRPPRGAD